MKTAKSRTSSSTQWLQRQLNDPYVARARAEGYRSRAAYKIKELDERYKLFRKGQRVVDLGAAPGGWSQVAVPIVGSTEEHPLIVGIDYLDMDPIPGVILLKKDFNDEDAPQALIDALGGHKADLVLSDMAAPTTGHRATDHIRVVQLVELAADFAIRVLAPGGAFVAKVFQGGTEHELLGTAEAAFCDDDSRQAESVARRERRDLPRRQRLQGLAAAVGPPEDAGRNDDQHDADVEPHATGRSSPSRRRCCRPGAPRARRAAARSRRRCSVRYASTSPIRQGFPAPCRAGSHACSRSWACARR